MDELTLKAAVRAVGRLSNADGPITLTRRQRAALNILLQLASEKLGGKQ